jgi:membrane-bound ClpP family serine protease
MGTWGPQHWAFLLAIIGILLLFGEVLIPSAGAIFVTAIACLAGSVFCAWQAWWTTDPGYFWGFVAGLAITLPMAGYWMLKLWERILFRADEADQQMTKTSPTEELKLLIGKWGRTVSPLMPAGIVVVDGERIHASSEGMIIDRDEPIRVVGVRSSRLIVRVVDAEELRDADLDTGLDDADGDEPLDFDVSEG